MEEGARRVTGVGDLRPSCFGRPWAGWSGARGLSKGPLGSGGRSQTTLSQPAASRNPARATLKHGFESRWGHQIVFVECFWSGFEKHSNVSRTHSCASYCLVSIASAFSS
jgi:hypothetical protein